MLERAETRRYAPRHETLCCSNDHHAAESRTRWVHADNPRTALPLSAFKEQIESLEASQAAGRSAVQ